MNKIFKLIILILLCFQIICVAQVNDKFEIKFRVKPWDESSWTSYDKYIHCFGGWILTNQIDKKYSWFKSFLIGQTASMVWEVKDGFIDWKKIGYWGGDGFDLKDHLAFTIGQLAQGLVDHILFGKVIYSTREKIVKKIMNKNLYKVN